jgi:transposase InsO family protein
LIIDLRRTLGGKGLDSGPHTICWHLDQHHGVVVSVATIWRHLHTAGLVVPEPKKKPKTAYIRFQADLPNETWQSDFTHWHLTGGDGVEIITFLDDHARYALSVTAHIRITGTIVVNEFLETAETNGFPASMLTDNGMVYTTRFATGKGGKNRFERTLMDLRIVQKHSRPNHPTTCGKVERFQQTLKKWLTAQPEAATLHQLQDQLDTFVDEYNHRRPHRSLGEQHPPRSTRRFPKPPQTTQTSRATTGSGTTSWETPEPSPSVTEGHSTTSASGEPTPEPTSSCSSTTSTSASSTPPPENSSAD